MSIIKKFIKSKPKETNEHIKLSLKGQQMPIYQDEYNLYSFKNTIKLNRGPEMFTSKTRFKIWGYLGLFFFYCLLLSKLILYRLKADDLDLMEREIKDEYEIKRKIKNLE